MSVEPTEAKAHVFISYSRVDRTRAEAIARTLAGTGVAVWIDQVDIPGGTAWSGEIVRGIRSCVAFVVLCSKAAMASSNVRRELYLALDHQRPILPLVLELAEIPDAIAYGLAGVQQVLVGERAERDWLPEVMRALAVHGMFAHSAVVTVPTMTLPVRRRHNLPAELTSFVGREREREEVKDALAKSRLLTLSGIGGIGKTRLSLQIAADVVDDFPDGVWFVELAPINDASLVGHAVASVLGVKEEAGRSLGEALVDFVRDRSLLLVLDNCEHLVAPCADLARQLLKAGPKSHRLVSTEVIARWWYVLRIAI